MKTRDDLIAETAAYLDGLLKDGLDPKLYAAGLINEADFSRAVNGRLHLEVRAFHTARKAPLPFCVMLLAR